MAASEPPWHVNGIAQADIEDCVLYALYELHGAGAGPVPACALGLRVKTEMGQFFVRGMAACGLRGLEARGVVARAVAVDGPGSPGGGGGGGGARPRRERNVEWALGAAAAGKAAAAERAWCARRAALGVAAEAEAARVRHVPLLVRLASDEAARPPTAAAAPGGDGGSGVVAAQAVWDRLVRARGV